MIAAVNLPDVTADRLGDMEYSLHRRFVFLCLFVERIKDGLDVNDAAITPIKREFEMFSGKDDRMLGVSLRDLLNL